jgi:hypothetical protein
MKKRKTKKALKSNRRLRRPNPAAGRVFYPDPQMDAALQCFYSGLRMIAAALGITIPVSPQPDPDVPHSPSTHPVE